MTDVAGDFEPHAEIYVEEFDETISVSHRSIGFALAWNRVESLVPTVTRANRRTGKDELVQEVRVVFRRKSGQWFVTVGPVSSARPTPAEALRDVADQLERNAAKT